jgi:hypothetical protein
VMVLKEMKCEGAVWINAAQNRDSARTVPDSCERGDVTRFRFA